MGEVEQSTIGKWREAQESLPTVQQLALSIVQEGFGPLSYTEDHQHFRLVGYYVGAYDRRCVQAIGDTWDEAIERLQEKSLHANHLASRRWPWRSTLFNQ